jgi:hypothetical protein
MRKYIRLYEEYTDLEQKSLEGNYSWHDVRNVIQLKLPYIIIDFKNEEERDNCIKKELFDEKYINQTYFLKKEDVRTIKNPSVFIFTEESDLAKRVLGLNSRFDIIRLIIGENGKDSPSLYVDSDKLDIGSNLYTTLNIDEIGLDDYYSIDGNYYKFID